MPNHKPLIFISHKHRDEAIAGKIAEFIRTITGGQVDVYLSSNPDFEGPRAGKPLGKELRDALWRAGLVILVYTSQDNDWSWCMWECGLADEPNSPDTKVVVLQCLRDKPQVFEDGVRVLAWQLNSLVSFAYRFGQQDFVPGANGPVTGLKESELKARAIQLHKDLLDVIPQEPPENWSAWPLMRLSLPRDAVESLHSLPEAGRIDAAVAAILEHAELSDVSSGLAQLFGKVDVAAGTPCKELVDHWQQSHPNRESGWMRVLAAQIFEGSKKNTPKVGSWARFRQVEGDAESVVGVGRIKKDLSTLQFDCYFFGLGTVVGVASRMTRLDKMYYLNIATKKASDVVLVDLLKDLEDKSWTRIPILDGTEAKYIAHVSMIDRFIRLSAIDGKEVSTLTLEDILADPEMENMFAGTFATVGADATVADALVAMRDTDRCQDVFVTKPAEGVIGWLTDRDVPIDELRVL